MYVQVTVSLLLLRREFRRRLDATPAPAPPVPAVEPA
jgi:hypothetical protein